MNLSNLTTRAKVMLGAIVVAVFSMQVDQVKNLVMPLIAQHPKLITLAGGIFTTISLLQNPVIQNVLGIEETKKITQSPDGTITEHTQKTSTLTKDA